MAPSGAWQKTGQWDIVLPHTSAASLWRRRTIIVSRKAHGASSGTAWSLLTLPAAQAWPSTGISLFIEFRAKDVTWCGTTLMAVCTAPLPLLESSWCPWLASVTWRQAFDPWPMSSAIETVMRRLSGTMNGSLSSLFSSFFNMMPLGLELMRMNGS